RRRHTRFSRDWSSDVCSSDLTSSSLMCWAACDRLAHIAAQMGESARVRYWRERADEIKERILAEAWSEKRKAFVESFGGETLDEIGRASCREGVWASGGEGLG